MIFGDFGATNDELTKFQGLLDAALSSVTFTVNNPAATPEGIQLAKKAAIEGAAIALNQVSAANKDAAGKALITFLGTLAALAPPSKSVWNSPAVKFGGLAALAGVVGFVVWRRHKKA